jgi:hypothetical protein
MWMVTLKRFLRGHYVITLLLAPILSGCFSLETTVTREINWKGITASARLEPPRAFSFTIHPDGTTQEFQIRMPDGKVFRTSQLNFETLWPYTFEGKLGAKLPRKTPPEWRTFSIYFEQGFWDPLAGSFDCNFQERRLTSLQISGNPSAPEHRRPAIGKVNDSKMYFPPLSEEQMVELFGPFESKTDTRHTPWSTTVTNYPIN